MWPLSTMSPDDQSRFSKRDDLGCCLSCFCRTSLTFVFAAFCFVGSRSVQVPEDFRKTEDLLDDFNKAKGGENEHELAKV